MPRRSTSAHTLSWKRLSGYSRYWVSKRTALLLQHWPNIYFVACYSSWREGYQPRVTKGGCWGQVTFWFDDAKKSVFYFPYLSRAHKKKTGTKQVGTSNRSIIINNFRKKIHLSLQSLLGKEGSYEYLQTHFQGEHQQPTSSRFCIISNSGSSSSSSSSATSGFWRLATDVASPIIPIRVTN